MRRRFFILSLLLLLIPLQLTYLYVKNDLKMTLGQVAGVETINPDSVLNWATIGEFRFTLFGYTSPYARVTIDGQGIWDQTSAKANGYFEFNNKFSPFSPHEACLTSRDQFGRVTSPACLPPFPTKSNVVIGPVLIPPSVSLDKDIYYVGDEVVLSGQTIPDSSIDLSIFINEKKSLLSRLNPIKEVSAVTFPRLQAKSDSKGNYSVSLPSSYSDAYRTFAQVAYDKFLSTESNKLSFRIYPVWMVIIRFFLSLLGLIKSRLLEIIILGEIIYIAYILYRFLFNPFYARGNRAIILRQDINPTVEFEELELNKSSDVPSHLGLYHPL